MHAVRVLEWACNQRTAIGDQWMARDNELPEESSEAISSEYDEVAGTLSSFNDHHLLSFAENTTNVLT